MSSCKRKRYDGGIILKEDDRLLGRHLDEVKTGGENENIKQTSRGVRGRKDKGKRVIPRVIKISQKENSIELIVTYFSDSLLQESEIVLERKYEQYVF